MGGRFRGSGTLLPSQYAAAATRISNVVVFPELRWSDVGYSGAWWRKLLA